MCECGFDWIKGDKTASFTFPAGTAMTNRIIALAKKYPDECQIMDRNKDGSIFGHIPMKWIKLNPTRKGRELTEEQKQQAKERLQKARETRKKKNGNDV